MARELAEYEDLEIRLTPGPEQVYNVELASASGARGIGRFAAPSELEVERFRVAMDPRNRAVRGRSHYLEAATQFGSGLFERVLADASVREVYTAAWDHARAAGHGLRISLSLRATPELASIPWEFLYDRPHFLAQHRNSPVVRFVDLEQPTPPLRVEPPLRILGMVSRPKDDELAGLDAEQEQAALEQRLGALIDTGQVEVRWLERATLQALQQEADHGEDFHVFHYIGHGEYDPDSGESSLVLEHRDRRPHRVGGQRLGALLCDRGSLRLAVLNACEAAHTSAQDPLAGVATALMEYEVPAVVAMQFAITDDGALEFADEFYRALADNYPVDAAVTQARRALAAASDVEWATPVLFLRVADGRLFDLQPATPAVAAGKEPAPAGGPQLQPKPAAQARRDGESVPRQQGRAAAAPGHLASAERPPIESERSPAPGGVPPRFREIARVIEDASVFDVAFAPDGRRIATASDGTACVWDYDEGRELVRVRHVRLVWAVRFSPDGSQIATSSADHTARLWDATSGRELVRVTHDKDVMAAVAFSPDGTRIATGSEDGTVRVWDAGDGRELARMNARGWIKQVIFSADGIRIISRSHISSVAQVWDSVSGCELARLTHDAVVTAAAFSSDGSRIVTASGDSARVWDGSGTELARLQHSDAVLAAVFSPDGSRIATGSKDRTARVWDSAGVREITRLPHDDAVSMVVFAPDGTRIATGSGAITYVWNAADGRQLGRLTHDPLVVVSAIAFSPDSSRIATGFQGQRETDASRKRGRFDRWLLGSTDSYGGAVVWAEET